MKKFWLLLLSDVIIGIIISIIQYSGESLFFQYTAKYADTTLAITEQNFDVTVGSLRIIFISVIVVMLVWFSIENLHNIDAAGE
ncbi:hypothetical protein JMA_09970 [Jeotgalibacillus malaysiensis]|uniref:Uncharacterized protein n=1 Tax=Jeotgalibacillus malaysiensis TaxID=1508404 RepID=A0A0B5AQI0_9BACL|nr:hypothetical protein [Jeotgalibacillus malaysiensis]AJD90314.1 hypothetical protein JMA_09970 [Jeotgalibacillus malaysiensis]